MATAVYLYSNQSSPALQSAGRSGLEDDLDEFLGEAGSTTGGGSGIDGWNVDLELSADDDIERWIERLSDFLRQWGVPSDAYLQIAPPGWADGDPVHTVFVFPEYAPKL